VKRERQIISSNYRESKERNKKKGERKGIGQEDIIGATNAKDNFSAPINTALSAAVPWHVRLE
jgi:hypothetical protein